MMMMAMMKKPKRKIKIKILKITSKKFEKKKKIILLKKITPIKSITMILHEIVQIGL